MCALSIRECKLRLQFTSPDDHRQTLWKAFSLLASYPQFFLVGTILFLYSYQLGMQTRKLVKFLSFIVIFLLAGQTNAATANAQLLPPRTRPVSGSLLRPFDHLAHNWLPGHRGVDISAAEDELVLAPQAGRVSWVGTINGVSGLSITHSNGLRSTYQPVVASVPVGVQVDRGTVVGRLQAGHCLTTPCLHLGLKRGEKYLDPWRWLNADLEPIKLLPIDQQIGFGTTDSAWQIASTESNYLAAEYADLMVKSLGLGLQTDFPWLTTK